MPCGGPLRGFGSVFYFLVFSLLFVSPGLSRILGPCFVYELVVGPRGFFVLKAKIRRSIRLAVSSNQGFCALLPVYKTGASSKALGAVCLLE